MSAGDKENANFTMEGAEALGGEIDTAVLMDICLAENDRRLDGYDPRLLRPTTVPRLVRLARLFIRPKRKNP